MNHSFLGSQINKLECVHCTRTYLAHTNAATCESCGRVRACDIFGNPKNPKSLLLCPDCTRKEIDANTAVIEKSKILADAARIDDSIAYNGDFFNAKTIALIEIKKAIDSDEALSAEQKKYKFQEVIAARYAKLKQVVFQLDKKKEELVTEQLVIAKNLRSFGEELRKDIRAKIAESDANYAPPIKVVKPRIAKVVEKKSPMERLIDAFVLMHGVSKEKAEEMIRKGKSV